MTKGERKVAAAYGLLLVIIICICIHSSIKCGKVTYIELGDPNDIEIKMIEPEKMPDMLFKIEKTKEKKGLFV